MNDESVIYVIGEPGSYGLETKLHRFFDAIRSHGEWFDFGDRDPVAEIRALVEAAPQIPMPKGRFSVPDCAGCDHSSRRHSTRTRRCCVSECPCERYVKPEREASVQPSA